MSFSIRGLINTFYSCVIRGGDGHHSCIVAIFVSTEWCDPGSYPRCRFCTSICSFSNSGGNQWLTVLKPLQFAYATAECCTGRHFMVSWNKLVLDILKSDCVRKPQTWNNRRSHCFQLYNISICLMWGFFSFHNVTVLSTVHLALRYLSLSFPCYFPSLCLSRLFSQWWHS